MTKLVLGLRVVEALSFSRFSAILSFAPCKTSEEDPTCTDVLRKLPISNLHSVLFENACFPPGVHNTEVYASDSSMESDLKRVARLEYLKLRQSKQSEKVEAVKVLYRIQIALTNIE